MSIQEFTDLWVDKYRPTRLADMVLNSSTKAMFENAIKSGNLTSCTFIGVQGSGKTSLAKMLANEFSADTLFIPCATEGGIDTLRTKVKQFTSAYSMSVKLVILDELDSASAAQDSSFQKGLRNLIEQSPDTRFICTANYNKIIPAVLSRCPVVDIRFEPKDILKRVVDILNLEKIEYTKADLKIVLDIINSKFPDIRSIITAIQRQVVDNKLNFDSDLQIVACSTNKVMADILTDLKSKKSLVDLRRNYIRSMGKSGDYLNLASDLYVHLLENNIITNPDHLQKLAHAIYEMNLVVDKEISFFGMICIIYLALTK